MARTTQGNRGNRGASRGRNNNPEGRNQYSGGVMEMARDNPMRTALGAAAAVGAGVFLWSRRNQITDQLSNLSDQIGEWTESMRSSSEGDSDFAMDTAAGTDSLVSSGSTTGARKSSNRGGKRSQSQISEEALSLKQTGDAI